MSIEYRVYAGSDTSGGPINYGLVVATTTDNAWTIPALNANEHVRYAVRAYDTVSGLEDPNMDVQVEIITDAAGNDISGRPRPPVHLSADAVAAGRIAVRWADLAPRDHRVANAYHVWAQTPGPIDYGLSPDAVVERVGSQAVYQAVLSGLTGGADYTIGVRAVNDVADDGNTDTVTVTAPASDPGDAPESPSGAASWED